MALSTTSTSASISHRIVETMIWMGAEDGSLRLIEQTLLPQELRYLECRDVESVFEAIQALRVRGAPAIGIAAAYGVVIGLQGHQQEDSATFAQQLNKTVDYLAASRPTAVNLFWALRRMQSTGLGLLERQPPATVLKLLLAEAKAIHEEDRLMCHSIGKHGAELVNDGDGVLTHCNAGGLATAEYGTALSVFFTAQDQGKHLRVFVDETRPLLQGARLTAWELSQRGIDTTLICDSMAAQVMREGKIHAVFVGADRIAANGDAANKIGTYSVALAAHAHGIPFYVAAPSSTFDLSIDSGAEIPIEQRRSEEITFGFGKQTAPTGVKVYNPAFDVTPARYITGLITEHGVIQPVNAASIRAGLLV
jgi:methylthioribose-1-phosphate isomerase